MTEHVALIDSPTMSARCRAPMMTDATGSLLPFYAGWRTYNERLVAAIAPLTPEQLALRTTPEHWSIGMYATHIVANRAWWFHTRMGEGATT